MPRTPRTCLLVLLSLVAAACGSPTSASDVSEPTTDAVVAPSTSLTFPTTVPPTTTPGLDVVGLVDGLSVGQAEAWASMATPAAETADVFGDLDALADKISVVFIGEISGPPVERLWKDTETDDSFVFYETPIKVETPLGGLRQLEAGDTINVFSFGGFPDELTGSQVVWFLMYAQDTVLGLDTIEGPDLYRLNPLSIWIDRGDGVPVAPISEVERMEYEGDLESFLFDDTNLPDTIWHQAELEARAMTMESFIEYIVERANQRS